MISDASADPPPLDTLITMASMSSSSAASRIALDNVLDPMDWEPPNGEESLFPVCIFPIACISAILCFPSQSKLPDPLATYFLNDKIGWAGGRRGTLLKTTNGGLEWEKVPNTSEYRTYYQIYFADSQTGWACTNSGKVFKTNDGGSNWTEISTSTNKAFHDMFFINAKVGWVVGGGSVNAEIFKTEDGGNSWYSQDSPAEKCLCGAYFLNSSDGWAVGMESTILKTSDGGNSCEPKNSGVTTVSWLEDIYFKDENIGFVVGEGILLQTLDGGDTWIQKNNISGWLEKIIFMDSNEQ